MSVMIDALGWLGMVLYVSAYYLVSSGRLSGRALLFQGLNMVAAVLVALNAGYYGSYPSCAVNLAWFLIGLLTVTGVITPPDGQSDRGLSHTNGR